MTRMHFDVGPTQIAITTASREALVTTVRTRLAEREGFALATLNLDHLVKLRKDPHFSESYQAHDLVVADGNPIVWLARLAGERIDLLPGSDLVVPLLELAIETGTKVAFVGSTPQALDRAAADLCQRLPDLDIAVRIAPPMGFDPTGAAADAIIDEIAAAGIGLCLVAFGAPKQENFAARARRRAPHIGFASIGAGLDFFARTQRRAPVWVRRLAMEWLWRLGTDPRRLAGRYAACAAILPGYAGAALGQRLLGARRC